MSLFVYLSNFFLGKKSIEANVEEDYYNDLLLFMTLLNTLHGIDNQNEDSRFLSNQTSPSGKYFIFDQEYYRKELIFNFLFFSLKNSFKQSNNTCGYHIDGFRVFNTANEPRNA